VFLMAPRSSAFRLGRWPRVTGVPSPRLTGPGRASNMTNGGRNPVRPSTHGYTMLRRLLSLFMTFMLVVGPSLCCCTNVYTVTKRPLATQSPDSTPPCCCKDQCPAKARDALGEPRGVRGESQSDPKPGKHQCPCKEKGGKPALGQTAPPSQTAQDLSRLLTAVLHHVVVSFCIDPVVDSGPNTGGLSPPDHRPTSWRLLNAPHMLRC